jgi:hypothetical protein
MSDVVQKLWGFCHTLRHDGIDYGDHIKQITFLLFLKTDKERVTVALINRYESAPVPHSRPASASQGVNSPG